MVLVVYNFFIFVVVRDKAFLYYLLYILCFGLYMSANDGFFYQMLMPESPDLANFFLLVLLGLSLLFATQFSRRILTITQFSRKLDIAAVSMIVLCVYGEGFRLSSPHVLYRKYIPDRVVD